MSDSSTQRVPADGMIWLGGELSIRTENVTLKEAYGEVFDIAEACGYSVSRIGTSRLMLSTHEDHFLVEYGASNVLRIDQVYRISNHGMTAEQLTQNPLGKGWCMPTSPDGQQYLVLDKGNLDGSSTIGRLQTIYTRD